MHRLVYADWLDENGDARASFVRKEVEFQQNYQTNNATRLADQLAKSALEIRQPSWQRVIVADRAAEVFLFLRQVTYVKSTRRRRKRKR